MVTRHSPACCRLVVMIGRSSDRIREIPLYAFEVGHGVIVVRGPAAGA